MTHQSHGLEKLADKFLPKGVALSELKTERMYVLLIMGMAVFSGFIFVFDLILHLEQIAYMCGTLAIGALAYLWLFKNNFTVASKLFSHIHVVAMILSATTIYSERAFVWAFLIPLSISSLVVFTKRQRGFSYVIISAVFLSIPLYMFIHNNHNSDMVNQPVMHLLYIINLSGSLIFSIFIVITLIRLNDSIFNELKLKSDENAKQNKTMLGSIRTRDKVLSMMSHDLRGEIGKTIGVIDVIERIPLEEQEKATLLNNLKRDAEHTLGLLDNMLQWSRTQQDDLFCTNTPYEVDVLLHHLITQSEYELNTKRILLHLDIPKNLTIAVDHVMIDSVFRNLLGNAIKFTPIDGVISISAQVIDDHVEFSIQDSGTGMTPEQIDNLLKGVQFTTRGTNREKGRGFGMVLVSEFLAKHKSQIQITSTPGKGSTFRFKLPLQPNHKP